MAIEIKCPVCNHTTTGNFCENCGFEIHVLPAAVSPEIVTYENERVAKYKEKQAELQTAKETAQREKDEQAEAARIKLEEQTETHRKEMEEKDGIIKEKDQTISAKDGEISGLNNQVTTLNDQITNLKKELEEAKKKPVRLDGIVRVIRKDGDRITEERFLPVFRGWNYYGTGIVKESNYHLIPMKRCGIEEKHFSVRRNSSNQMVIKPEKGTLTCNSRPVPAEGKAVEVYDAINIGDEIEIRVDCYFETNI